MQPILLQVIILELDISKYIKNLKKLSNLNKGWTPLIRYANMGGHHEIGDLLIKFKPDLNTLDFECKSALMVAAISGNLHLTKLLIDHGADVTIKNKFGKNIYDMASSMGNNVSYSFLL